MNEEIDFELHILKNQLLKALRKKTSVWILKMTLLHKLKSKFELFHVLLVLTIIEVCIH